jgi:hypothetical protein
MVKATLRSAVLLGTVAAAMFAASMPGFAEVQNVRVGGDITLRGIHQEATDLNDERNGSGQDSTYYTQLTTGLNVGADMTENVSAFIRLSNEHILGNNFGANSSAGDFDISQAWVKFKELFYSPVTVTAGIQPIWWGRGLVLGSNLIPSLLDSDGGIGDGATRNETLEARQFTDFTAFNAFRAELNLGNAAAVDLPVNLEYVYIKQTEGSIGEGDDYDIHGLKASTAMDEMSSEMDLYWLWARDKRPAHGGTAADESEDDGNVHTVGLRGSTQPADGTLLFGEAAIQFGTTGLDLDHGISATGSGAQAWLFNLGAEMSLGDESAMSPKVGAEWIYTSGHDKDGAFSGWQPIAPGYFPTLIRAFQTRSTIAGLYPVDQAGVTSAFTNQNEFALYGGLKPMEDLSLDTRLSLFWSSVGIIQPSDNSDQTRNSFLGTEWDTWLAYNYTDDVQFGLSYGVLFPGGAFVEGAQGAQGSRNTAQQLVSTVSVKF